ncbi:hypothetical protein HH308_10515 [Gordonia sp. TBRC 11910]|uniref:Uncharacterized protein n=1 Tax=Gordonia asplenii TaxID=2725283 RepID=A0A848KXR4_9ACTN|nr:hypothetical protein [Gordonia asplenii]NMO01645.1 hypothetical protein [Gordonia asplenii]
MTTPRQAAVVLTVERVEQLGTTMSSSAQTVGALAYWALQPATKTGDTFSALASCVTPATTTTDRLSSRLGRSARAVAITAVGLRNADIYGAARMRASF